MRLRPEAECLGGELRPLKRSHSESVSEPRLLVSTPPTGADLELERDRFWIRTLQSGRFRTYRYEGTKP